MIDTDANLSRQIGSNGFAGLIIHWHLGYFLPPTKLHSYSEVYKLQFYMHIFGSFHLQH